MSTAKSPLFVCFSAPLSFDIPLLTLYCTEDEEKQAIGMREKDAGIECDRCAARDSDDQRNPCEELARQGPYSITVNSLGAESNLLISAFLLFRFVSVPCGIVATTQHTVMLPRNSLPSFTVSLLSSALSCSSAMTSSASWIQASF